VGGDSNGIGGNEIVHDLVSLRRNILKSGYSFLILIIPLSFRFVETTSFPFSRLYSMGRQTPQMRHSEGPGITTSTYTEIPTKYASSFLWSTWDYLWRMPSSGMWRSVDLAWPDVSEERMASISSKTLGHTRPTRSHIPEDGILHSHRRENLKFYVGPFILRKEERNV
jgi:hypothetical protein